MPDDPNADLIGFVIPNVGEIIGTWEYNPAYVLMRAYKPEPGTTTIRFAATASEEPRQADSPLRAGEAGDLIVHPAAWMQP